MDSHALSDRDSFENWLVSMDDFLEDFVARVPASERSKLDFSVASLDVAEAWLLAEFPNVDAAVREASGFTVNGAACYVGQVLRKAVGGKWDICLDDPSDAFHALPIVRWGKTYDCPLTLVTAAVDRRTGSYLTSVTMALLQ